MSGAASEPGLTEVGMTGVKNAIGNPLLWRSRRVLSVEAVTSEYSLQVREETSLAIVSDIRRLGTLWIGPLITAPSCMAGVWRGRKRGYWRAQKTDSHTPGSPVSYPSHLLQCDSMAHMTYVQVPQFTFYPWLFQVPFWKWNPTELTLSLPSSPSIFPDNPPIISIQLIP